MADLILLAEIAVARDEIVEANCPVGKDFEFSKDFVPILTNASRPGEQIPTLARDHEKIVTRKASEKPKETTTQREIDMLKGLIDQVHRPDYIKI